MSGFRLVLGSPIAPHEGGKAPKTGRSQNEGIPEVLQDYAQAATWFRKAADLGNPVAQVNLGNLYVEGKGMPRDYSQAAEWYRKAADQGVPKHRPTWARSTSKAMACLETCG